jgi:hypothetical protein
MTTSPRPRKTLYSLVQTAVANNLETFDYLKHRFTEIPKLGRHYEPEALDQFLLWNLTKIMEPLNQAAWLVYIGEITAYVDLIKWMRGI